MSANRRIDPDISGRAIAYGRYQLERLLSSDTLGNLYLALDRHLEVKVAVRIVHDHLAQDNHFAARFVKMARASILHFHPNLVRVYDFGDVDNHLYVALELLNGASLAEMLQERHSHQQWIALDEAIFVAQQVGQALAYLHRSGFHTRSVEPRQIVLRQEVTNLPIGRFAYQPVIIDLPVDSPHRLMGDYGLAPSYAYMPPEVVLRQGADERSDVYMLGALLWELVVGHPLFPADNIADAVDFHVNHRQVPVRVHHPKLPEEVGIIIEKALAQLPEQRYPTVAALLQALMALPTNTLQEILPPATTAAPLNPQPESGARAPVQPTQSRTPAPPPAPYALPDSPPEPQPAPPPAPGSPVPPESEPPMLPPAGLSLSSTAVAMELQVHNSRQGKRVFPVNKDVLTIGRSPDNDVWLDDPRVSRRHAQVEFDGVSYTIADLKSANGILIGERRIPPGDRVLCTPGMVMRMGESVLQLAPRQPGHGAQTDVPLPQNAMQNIRPPSALHQLPGMAGGTGIAIVVEEEHYEVEPGQHLVIPILVRNLKPNADLLVLAVEGVPITWMSYPPAVRLEANSQERVNLQVQPPRSPQTVATSYSLQINATSQQDPSQRAYTHFTLSIAPYGRVHVELQPATINEGETMRINIGNQGNSAQLIKLMWWDDQHELDFQPKDAEVYLQPGESSFVEFSTSAQKVHWLAQTKSFPITVQAHPQVGQLQLCKGTVVRRGRMPIR